MAEPVDLDEAKAQVRMTDDDSEDTFITSLIAPARAFVEKRTGYSFVAGTRTLTFYRWSDLSIFLRPIESIDSVTYAVSDDPEDDVAYEGFYANVAAYPVRIAAAFGGNGFPTLADGSTITVTVTTGALDDESIEYLIGKRAILLLIGYWFDNRGEGPLTEDQERTLEWCLKELTPVSAY